MSNSVLILVDFSAEAGRAMRAATELFEPSKLSLAVVTEEAVPRQDMEQRLGWFINQEAPNAERWFEGDFEVLRRQGLLDSLREVTHDVDVLVVGAGAGHVPQGLVERLRLGASAAGMGFELALLRCAAAPVLVVGPEARVTKPHAQRTR